MKQQFQNDYTSSLRSISSNLNSIEEQTLFYLSTISACSGLFTRLSGTYHQRTVYSNLFFITSAPPASGKGLMMSSRTLLKKIHGHFATDSKAKLSAYKQQLGLGKKCQNEVKSLTKPPFMIPIIPGNCTSSKLIQHLADNSKVCPCILIESEIDTLANANKSDYGGFSDLLRKSFSNEPISYTRKMNDEFIEVDEPKLAIVLSGTPNQIQRLIGTAEDGLFSRFMFFSFAGKTEWEDVSPALNAINFQDLLNSHTDNYYKLWKFYEDRDVTFSLEERHWVELNQTFKDELEDTSKADNPYSIGVVKRHGIILFKLCMVLTAIRMFDLNIADNHIVCDDRDFKIAKGLAMISLDCSMDLLDQMPAPQKNFKVKTKKEEYFNKLTTSFSRSEAVDLGKTYKVSARTIDRWLLGFANDARVSIELHGKYEKVIAT